MTKSGFIAKPKGEIGFPFDDLYINDDSRIMNVVGSEYGIRNWANSVYKIWGCVQLNVAGTSAIVEIGDAKVLGNTSKAPSVVIMTTTQRNALTGRNGMLIYNSTTNELEKYENNVWKSLAENVQWTDYPTVITGFSGIPTINVYYKKVGRTVFVNFYINGTSNDTVLTFTLPYTNINETYAIISTALKYTDNNVKSPVSGMLYLVPNSNVAVCYTDWNGGIWTPGNIKEVTGQFWYEVD